MRIVDQAASVVTSEFTNNDALIALLTVETLAFAALAVAVSFSVPSNRVPDLPGGVTTLGYFAAAFVTVVAVGGLMPWLSLFLDHWPKGFRGSVIAITLGVAVVGQPVFAWVIAHGLKSRP